MDMPMQMSFYVGELHNFLIKGWNATTWTVMLGTCLAVAVVVIILDALTLTRVYLGRHSQKNPLTSGQSERAANERSPLVRPLLIPPSIQDIKRRKIYYHLAQSGLHLLQVITGYLVMLAVMSYNVYIFITVIAASALAYFTLGAIRDLLILEELQPTTKQPTDEANPGTSTEGEEERRQIEEQHSLQESVYS